MIKNIVIVGGGFAGWYTAAAIKNNCPDIHITIIDSDLHPRLGVGETLGFSAPYDWKRLLNLKDDRMLMWRTGSVYKYGTTAKNFYADGMDISYGKFFNLKIKSLAKFYGEFDYPEFYEPWSKKPGDVGVQQAWLSINKLNDKNIYDYIQEVNEASHFVKNALAPYDQDNRYILRPAEGWSYQIDAEQMVALLKDIAFENNININHISSAVADVVLKDQSQCDHLLLANGQKLSADLFIDATGNARVLMKRSENNTWTNMGSEYCNSAWVTPTRYIDPAKELVGATEFTGEDWGWRFKIGLYHRQGNGYIFNSNMIDPTVPLDHITKVTEGRRLADPRLIQWTPGYYQEPWQGNILALGISSHLIDPFDAPTFDVQSRALTDLVELLKTTGSDVASKFNAQNKLVVEERNIRLRMTFGLSRRTGEFWDSRRSLLSKHHSLDDLKDILNGKRKDLEGRLPHFWHQMYYRLCMAAGIDRSTIETESLIDSDRAMAESFFAYNRARNQYIAQQSWPNYYEWLKQNRFNGRSSNEILAELHPQWA